MNTLPSVSLKRPLVNVWTATALLDCTEDVILKKIESGELPFAFDLRCEGSQRACIRILSRCIAELQSRGPDVKGTRFQATADNDLVQVINSIVSPNRISFRSGEVARMFNCNLGHLDHLAKAGNISRQPIRGALLKTYKISRDSIVRFLTQRRML